MGTQITVIDHRTDKESKMDTVKDLIERSKASGGQGSRKLFKLPIKLVSEISSGKDHQGTAPNTSGGSQSASGADTTKKPSLFEQLKARLSKDSASRSSYASTGHLSGAGTPKTSQTIGQVWPPTSCTRARRTRTTGTPM
jgi:hypothetical protein